jgi:hypothetical protein
MFSTAAAILSGSALKVCNHAARCFHLATIQHDIPQHAAAPAGAAFDSGQRQSKFIGHGLHGLAA